MKKTGLFGGTFDPVHNGHLAIGRAALRQLALDVLYFIPAASPPHKDERRITPFPHRVAMLRLALAGEPRFVVSEVEGLRSGPSYTIDTLAHFRRSRERETEFFFLIGLDAFAEITTWKRYGELLHSASFVVINRPSHGCQSVASVVAGSFPDYEAEAEGVWKKEGSNRIYSLAMAPSPVSSSMVRQRLGRGEAVDDLLPPGVPAYLRQHRLLGAA